MDTPSGSHLTHSLSKPLPSLPPASHFVNLSPPTPVLSTHSRNHLHAFLQRALVEEGLIYEEDEAENSAKAKTDDPHASQSEDKEQSWVTELEGALEELGRSIASGRWLAGLRKKRVDLKLRLDMLEKQQVSKHDEPSAKDQDSASSTGTVKAEHVDLEAQQPDGVAGLRLSRASARTNSTVELSMDSEAEHRDTVLRHLGTLVLRPVNDTNETTSMHLLLAISPFSGALVRTTHDSGLDHVGSKIGCSFSPHHFNLTHEGKIGGTILFGVNEWSGKPTARIDHGCLLTLRR
jgi:1-phosphatidylinositol-3-phosphate 5-kinase